MPSAAVPFRSTNAFDPPEPNPLIPGSSCTAPLGTTSDGALCGALARRANHVQLARQSASSRRACLCNTRDMTIRRLDHVSVVVDDLAAAIAFFTALGMTLEGQIPLEGPWVDRITTGSNVSESTSS
jgi:glyoxalase/bleomycin resistance protein/dioxygenase superfamily protein